MNRPVVVIYLCLMGLPAAWVSKAQPLVWVRDVAVLEFGQSVGDGVAVDADGGVYTVGFVGGKGDFDADGTPEFTSDFDSPVILRYNADGSLAWYRIVQTTLGGRARSIALDGQGGLYVTGDVGSTADFDGDGTADVVSQSQATSVFVARYDTDGTFRWVRSTCGVRGNDVAVDRTDGSVVATGQSSFCADFDGNGRPDDATPRGLYTVKYASDGTLRWARFPKKESGDGGKSVAVDEAGNVYVGGVTDDTADFSGDGVVDLRAPMFVAKYDAAGLFKWVRGITPSQFSDGVQAIAVAGNALYVAGGFAGTADFSNEGTPDLTASAGSVGDLFVARYDLDGSFEWARSGGGGDGTLAMARDLVADADGVYATGMLSGRVDFNADAVPELARGVAMFVARYDRNGTFKEVWAPQPANVALLDGSSEGNSMAAGPDGSMYITGLFTGNINFSGTGTVQRSTSSFAWFTARYQTAHTSTLLLESREVLSLDIHPRPFAGTATLTVTAPAGQRVRVELFDLLGRRVQVLHDDVAGGSLLLEGRHLAPGTYVLRATTQEAHVARLITHVGEGL